MIYPEPTEAFWNATTTVRPRDLLVCIFGALEPFGDTVIATVCIAATECGMDEDEVFELLERAGKVAA